MRDAKRALGERAAHRPRLKGATSTCPLSTVRYSLLYSPLPRERRIFSDANIIPKSREKTLAWARFFWVEKMPRKETFLMENKDVTFNSKKPKLFVVYGHSNTGKTEIINALKKTMLEESGWEDVTTKCGVDVSGILKKYPLQQSNSNDIFLVLKKNDVLIGLFSEGDYPRLWLFIWILIFIIGCSGVVIATSDSEKLLPFVDDFEKIQKDAGLENVKFFKTERYRESKSKKKEKNIEKAVLEESNHIFERIEEIFIKGPTATEGKK